MRRQGGQVCCIDLSHIEPPDGQVANQQVTRVAVHLPGGHDPFARAKQGQQRGGNGAHAGGDHERRLGRFSAEQLHGGDVDGWVAEPAVPDLVEASGLDVLVGLLVQESS